RGARTPAAAAQTAPSRAASSRAATPDKPPATPPIRLRHCHVLRDNPPRALYEGKRAIYHVIRDNCFAACGGGTRGERGPGGFCRGPFRRRGCRRDGGGADARATRRRGAGK